jgi:hypothetical protein
MIRVKFKDESIVEYAEANDYESNGAQCFLGNRVNGVMEVIAAVPVEDIQEIDEEENETTKEAKDEG